MHIKAHGVIGTPNNYRTLSAQLVEASMPQIPDDPHVAVVVAAPRVITASGRGRGRPPGVKNKPKETVQVQTYNLRTRTRK